MLSETEELLIDKAVEGDKQAFSALMNLHSRRIFGLAYEMVKDKDLANEVAQESFVKAYLSIKKFRGEAKFSSWLYRIAYRTALDILRQQKKWVSLSDDTQTEKKWKDETETNAIESKEAWVRQCIDNLEPEEAALVKMFYYEKMSLNDISEATGFSLSNTKVKIHRLRNKLKQLLEQKPEIIYHYG